jgi:hypothetical protein
VFKSIYQQKKHMAAVHPLHVERVGVHFKRYNVNFKMRVIRRLEEFREPPGSNHEFRWGALTQVAREFKIDKSMVMQ